MQQAEIHMDHNDIHFFQKQSLDKRRGSTIRAVTSCELGSKVVIVALP